MFFLIVSILLLSIHHGQCLIQGTANLQFDGTSTSIGTLTFIQNDANSPVQVIGTLTLQNQSNTTHGFHVHTLPVTETSPNCTAALGHFNPYDTGHGPREADIWHRHVGDLGNLTSDGNGVININFGDVIIQFYNATQSIANRTIIIHKMSDDGGTTNTPDSNSTGNAGARMACGLIKLSSHGLNLQPTISTFFLTMIIAFIMVLY